MSAAARVGLLLLGLLALAGALHAPLHEDDGGCAPASLCSGASPLDLAGEAETLAAASGPGIAQQAADVSVPRDQRPRLTVRGRAPPRA